MSEKNLQEEKAHGRIFVTGNTVIDALHMVVDKLKSDKALADVKVNGLVDAMIGNQQKRDKYLKS